jgi:hypothetical protein
MLRLYMTIAFALGLVAPSVALADDCDYCVQPGNITCTHSGTFRVCGEGGRVLCGIANPNSTVTFGKCGNFSADSNALSITRDGNSTTIKMPNSSAEKFKSELEQHKP